MQKQFLKYFENELEKIRNSLEDFEQLHPQKAKTLGISAGKSDDPNLQRLSDSFAFLAAGLSSQIDQGNRLNAHYKSRNNHWDTRVLHD